MNNFMLDMLNVDPCFAIRIFADNISKRAKGATQ